MASLVVNEVVTLTASLNLGDSLVYIAGKGLFANSASTPSSTTKWANPLTDLATFTTLAYPNSSPSGSEALSVGMCYSPSQNRLYQAFQAVDNGTNWVVRVNKINPDDMSYSLFLDIVYGNSSTTDSPRSPNVTTDDTYLYIATQTISFSATESEVRKYRLSDGALIGSRTITGKMNTHPFAYDPASGKLLMGGTSPTNHAWVGWMTTDMASHSVIEVAAATSIVNDDLVPFTVGGTDYFWIENESGSVSPRQAWRVKKDLSAFDSVSLTGVTSGFPDGAVFDTVNNVLLVCIKDTVLHDGRLLVIDPSTLAILNNFSIGSGIESPNEIIRVGASTLLIATYEGTSKVARATLDLSGGGGVGTSDPVATARVRRFERIKKR